MASSNTLQVWRNARLSPRADPAEVIENAAIVVRDGRIEWFGAEAEMPPAYTDAVRHDLQQRIVTPGLVDCHTHLVYAGNRAEEFAMRLEGASYEDIAKRGGGIVSTVRNTRAASEDELFAQSLRRLDALLAEGVTALEIKSGYGLDLATERKMLRVARRLAETRPVTISTTFLGAHALPPEYAGRADDYIDHVCNEMLPTLADEGLVDAVDVFCERIAFTLEQAERVFSAASKLNLPVKMHAEQLSLMGGAALAAKHHALSADHLEFLDEAGAIAMREAGTVAVLLPGAFYFIREKQLPPTDLLRRHDVPIALATDSNPGTSPSTSLLLMLNMGCTLFRLSVAEVLAGVTRHGAKALGHADVTGEIKLGAKADFVAWDIVTLAELAYWTGLERCALVVRHGAVTVDKRKIA
ncbi:MAG: imidazolonepropionase [Pseudomonadota bacterium]|uniref:Imidazolonepropionase n=1 Tax=Caballeronia sordidicola TaxID=196367 RepID=A0A242MKB1_CABSO|nr:imidazolonepropionase [Caballeronia sordidicola]MDP9153599.1 imidazolonepropionase [Pseudomonadota bacterium]OTP71403.1 Imidazolonepropionase [Caballeronia sordidicola]